MRGEIASFDIHVPETGELIVEQGRRITARHIKQMEKSQMQDLVVPRDYLIGKTLAKILLIPQPVNFWLKRMMR